MATARDDSILRTIPTVTLITLFALSPVKAQSQNVRPVADAGSSRYAAQDPVVLDGTGSYDPDSSESLSYTWQQIGGPSVVMIDANTATPTIAGSIEPGTGRDPTPKPVGFTQTDEIQECEFELVVNDGELPSVPDTVAVIIVPDFWANTLQQENPPFDPDKPTVIYFGGGNCISGGGEHWGSSTAWGEKANIIRATYGPDTVEYEDWRTYYHMGDMIIVYLSSVAPEYTQLIQTIGWSTGGQPAMDVGIRLNRGYKDIRYAINRVTLLDAPCRFLNQSPDVFYGAAELFLASAVDGEQCWIDNYWGSGDSFENVVTNHMLDVWLQNYGHAEVQYWYRDSLADPLACNFNGGIVGGAYWSVVGPGKNLQRTQETAHQFHWSSNVGMSLLKETKYPGRFLEPVHLTGPEDGAVVDADGALLTCEESENAVGYQLLFGSDPYHVSYMFSDTPSPPSDPVSFFPFEQTWWTIRAYDQYGSTIHADPLHLHAERVRPQTIENVITGQRYASIQQAINDAYPGDEIVASPGVYQYLENITFKGENLTLRSTDPNDPAVVAATVINGGHRWSSVIFCGGEEASCVLDGFTITGGTVGISCRDASPTIRNCTIGSGGPNSIEFWYGSEPIMIDCTVLGQIAENDPRLAAYWKLDETEGNIAYDSAGDHDGSVMGTPVWQSDGGHVDGALELDGVDDHLMTDFVLNPARGAFSVFAWVKGGAPGQVVLSQTAGANWLVADSVQGRLMTELKHPGRGGSSLCSETMITDANWHHIGFTWDGSARSLYVDDILVADEADHGLAGSDGGLYIGAGSTPAPGTYWSGLIDDVRIYNRAVKP